MSRAALLILVSAFFSSVAAAQPKVCGNQAALGSWSLPSCPLLKDDGVAPDEAAGDGIYSAAVQLTATALLEYKILPTGSWDGATEIKEAASCSFDGSGSGNSNLNIQVASPDVSRPTLFYYDGRTLTDSTYSPAMSSRSAGDSAMVSAPAGSCPSWLAVGDFQSIYGNNASAVKLTLLRPGILAGRMTAAQALPSGWRWKVLEQSSGAAREYGPAGWAYAPCQTSFAAVSQAVAVGDSVYFLFHVAGGRLQTLSASAPLDGFTPDGSGHCDPVGDLGSTPLDLAGSSEPPGDLGGPSTSDLGSGDGGMHPRLGIHCDCQIAAAASQPAPSGGWAVGLGLGFALCFRGHRRRLQKRLPAHHPPCHS